MNAKHIIKSLGGVAATARLCEVSNAAVSQWSDNGIPKPRLMYLRLARPDIFAEERPGEDAKAKATTRKRLTNPRQKEQS
jgi:hypothetical protein